jgi:hypothetical protein
MFGISTQFIPLFINEFNSYSTVTGHNTRTGNRSQVKRRNYLLIGIFDRINRQAFLTLYIYY